MIKPEKILLACCITFGAIFTTFLIFFKYFIVIFGDSLVFFINVLIFLFLIFGGAAYYKSDYPARLRIQRWINFCKRKNDTHNLALTIIALGRWYSNRGEKNKAIDFYEKALSVVSPLEEYDIKHIATNFIGCEYMELKNYQQAQIFLQTSLDLSKKLHDDKLTIDSIRKLADLYHKMGYVDEEKNLQAKLHSLNLD